MIAANIGAGSTVGAAGLAYRDGISAWWWVGSAGLGSIVFALWVAPRLWRVAKEHNFYTTGDYLEFRYGVWVRGIAVSLVGLGSLALLAGQLIAGAAILNVITGAPRWVGALVGGGVMTIYFTAGGLLGSAWVNTLQLIVMMTGFAVALPAVTNAAGGLHVVVGPSAPPWFGNALYSTGPGSGWTLLALTGPAFVISPGLIQKSWGGASERAVRTGVVSQRGCARALRVRSRVAWHDRPGRYPWNRGSQRGASDGLDATPAAVARRDRTLGRLLDRSRHVRRDPVHDLDVGVEGSL